MNMYTDCRSKKVIFLAHCILNQNSISDGTADFPGSNCELVEFLLKTEIGIVQMPCPELHCLGLDRGNINGGKLPVVVGNTRIRKLMSSYESIKRMKNMVNQLVKQMDEYIKNGFILLGIVGIDRSPSCGVNTTSMNNKEVDGEGVFVKLLQEKKEKKNINMEVIGMKSTETKKIITEIEKIIM